MLLVLPFERAKLKKLWILEIVEQYLGPPVVHGWEVELRDHGPMG